MTKDTRNTTLSNVTTAQMRRLQELAEQFGCVATVGGSAGSGSVSALVRAIADGELVITKAPQWTRDAFEGEDGE